MPLTLSRDRKAAPSGTYQPKYDRWVPSIRNSLGLAAGASCPGRTEFCVSCYGIQSEQSAGVRSAMRRNLDALLEAGSIEGMTRLLDEAVDGFAAHADRKRLPAADRLFRIHWDGDFFSEDYARAWRRVLLRHLDIQFWAYTRSFTPEVNVVPILARLPNLELYLSVDRYNHDRAAAVLEEWPSVHAALCADTEAHARALLPDRRSVACPENIGRVSLMSEGRGACTNCRLCVDGAVDVRFLTTNGRGVIRTPVSLAAFPANTTRCASPECDNGVPHFGGVGRPHQFCSTKCRHRAAYLRRTERRLTA